jgi:membrane protease YdiL (CAAX protease family)
MTSSDSAAVTRQRHKRRLQRAPNAAGFRVSTFREVIQRHGVTMGCIAAVCMMTPGAWQALTSTTSRSLLQPGPYLIALLGLLLFFAIWSNRRPHTARRQAQWVLYLLYISIAEEIAFRLMLPSLLSSISPDLTLLATQVISNFVFAAIHYVTLRWKLKNCIFTFLGGMGLSHMMRHGDLTMVIMVHWLGTFLNTPFPPHRKKVRENPGDD